MYVMRTMKNVDSSDATLVFKLKESPGTNKTIGYCVTKKWIDVKRSLLVDGGDISSLYKPCFIVTEPLWRQSLEQSGRQIRDFLVKHRVTTLNVAGHRDEVTLNFSDKIQNILIVALS